jgi:uncharacterized DUF497 family protein
LVTVTPWWLRGLFRGAAHRADGWLQPDGVVVAGRLRPRYPLNDRRRRYERDCGDWRSTDLGLTGVHRAWGLAGLGLGRLEFDPGKSAANLAKHGIDFADAQALWDDEDHLEVPARTQDEPCWVVIGRIDGRPWTAIITRRQGLIRIISVRRARPSEEALYEGH